MGAFWSDLIPHGWQVTRLGSEDDAIRALIELQGKPWLYRGQSKPYGRLTPSIDRDNLENLDRREKLERERKAINILRSNARFFASEGEELALGNDVAALMVLRHYGVPTRLLDWSKSPYVAMYFAACSDDEHDGELWSFDEPAYRDPGAEQWKKWPVTTTDGTGDRDKFDANLTAFLPEAPDWCIAAFYPFGFPRQNAQQGAYTMTALFGVDHAAAIKKLLPHKPRCHLYIVDSHTKARMRAYLREFHGIWRGTLFPDTAGVAETVSANVFPNPGS